MPGFSSCSLNGSRLDLNHPLGVATDFSSTICLESGGVAAIGIDEENLQYVAYRRDGSLYGKFSSNSDMMQSALQVQRRGLDQSSCTFVSETDLEQR
jgi:hypothetical protein